MTGKAGAMLASSGCLFDRNAIGFLIVFHSKTLIATQFKRLSAFERRNTALHLSKSAAIAIQKYINYV